jgi:hypothetical protein
MENDNCTCCSQIINPEDLCPDCYETYQDTSDYQLDWDF